MTEAAEADLVEIWCYLAAESSEVVATKFLDRLKATFEPVRHFPFAEPSREDFAPGLRVTFQAPYAIYYLVESNELIIVRVVHSARDTAAIAARGGGSSDLRLCTGVHGRPGGTDDATGWRARLGTCSTCWYSAATAAACAHAREAKVRGGEPPGV